MKNNIDSIKEDLIVMVTALHTQHSVLEPILPKKAVKWNFRKVQITWFRRAIWKLRGLMR